MADISKITLPSGTTYNIKDATARANIEALSGYTTYAGVTTTTLTDGSNATTIKVNNANVTATNGMIANCGSKEFIFNGSTWQEFGDLSGLGSLAYKNSASTSYTPSGTISTPTFTGTAVPHTHGAQLSGLISNTALTEAQQMDYSLYGELTPAGTISTPTFTGTAASHNHSFTGTQATISSTISASSSGTANYTPAGTISTPTITVTPTTNTNYSITGVGSLPSCTLPTLSMSVSDETLAMSWSAGSFSAGSLPTRSSQTVVTAVSASASTPTFTGTGTRLTASATYTPAGTVANKSVTPAGTISTPTFTGASKYLALASPIIGNASIKPSGTISQPTFTGTAKTITVQ